MCVCILTPRTYWQVWGSSMYTVTAWGDSDSLHLRHRTGFNQRPAVYSVTWNVLNENAKCAKLSSRQRESQSHLDLFQHFFGYYMIPCVLFNSLCLHYYSTMYKIVRKTLEWVGVPKLVLYIILRDPTRPHQWWLTIYSASQKFGHLLIQVFEFFINFRIIV
jgi:hypothetical protein